MARDIGPVSSVIRAEALASVMNLTFKFDMSCCTCNKCASTPAALETGDDECRDEAAVVSARTRSLAVHTAAATHSTPLSPTSASGEGSAGDAAGHAVATASALPEVEEEDEVCTVL
eukprot:CAMPEP_0179423464 /NCGR_PEP_ID=MMETSP0799-20121207/11026_1 /TAXON_ID=46947 /ORGANISM="Geminigera cryophila, Strain CCMP2564" /LENGTH=116 /DNA_ID=CAMNT_0021197765 /DNA_START=515 /DNA_END=866 /DNA_ORIENTATION=+